MTQLFRLVISGKLFIFLHVALNHSRFYEDELVFQVHENLSAGANEAVVHTVEEGQFSSIVSLSFSGIEFW